MYVRILMISRHINNYNNLALAFSRKILDLAIFTLTTTEQIILYNFAHAHGVKYVCVCTCMCMHGWRKYSSKCIDGYGIWTNIHPIISMKFKSDYPTVRNMDTRFLSLCYSTILSLFKVNNHTYYLPTMSIKLNQDYTAISARTELRDVACTTSIYGRP